MLHDHDGRLLSPEEEAEARAAIAAGTRLKRDTSGGEFLLAPEAEAAMRAEWQASSQPTREQLKQARAEAVAAITVTTAAGNTFDGDEVSQGRMARAIIGLNAAGPAATVNWVLANNTVIDATAAELTEALVLAGQAQAAVWVLP